MTLFISLIVLALGVSGVLLFTKTNFPKAEKLLTRMAFFSLVGIILCVVLLSNDLRPKGAYTSGIIGMVFLLTTLILFGLSKRTTTKIWSSLITIPIFICCLLSLFDKGYLFFFYLLFKDVKKMILYIAVFALPVLFAFLLPGSLSDIKGPVTERFARMESYKKNSRLKYMQLVIRVIREREHFFHNLVWEGNNQDVMLIP